MNIPGRGRKEQKKICFCKDSVTVVRMGMLRRLTVGCCFPWRCKLRFASQHRDERAAVPARELRSPLLHLAAGPASHQSAQPTATLPRQGTHSCLLLLGLLDASLAAEGPNKPETWAKGPMEGLPAGPALHGRAPVLSKQAMQRAAGHGQHATCH